MRVLGGVNLNMGRHEEEGMEGAIWRGRRTTRKGAEVTWMYDTRGYRADLGDVVRGPLGKGARR